MAPLAQNNEKIDVYNSPNTQVEFYQNKGWFLNNSDTNNVYKGEIGDHLFVTTDGDLANGDKIKIKSSRAHVMTIVDYKYDNDGNKAGYIVSEAQGGNGTEINSGKNNKYGSLDFSTLLDESNNNKYKFVGIGQVPRDYMLLSAIPEYLDYYKNNSPGQYNAIKNSLDNYIRKDMEYNLNKYEPIISRTSYDYYRMYLQIKYQRCADHAHLNTLSSFY